jgi:hypothetical protein
VLNKAMAITLKSMIINTKEILRMINLMVMEKFSIKTNKVTREIGNKVNFKDLEFTNITISQNIKAIFKMV